LGGKRFGNASTRPGHEASVVIAQVTGNRPEYKRGELLLEAQVAKTTYGPRGKKTKKRGRKEGEDGCTTKKAALQEQEKEEMKKKSGGWAFNNLSRGKKCLTYSQ